MDGWFKDILELCEPCMASSARLLLALLPIFILLLVVLLLLLVAALRSCTRFDPCRMRSRLARAQSYGRDCLQSLFGPISARAVGLVLFAKIKIVVSMLQIQLGVIVAFDIRFPEHLMAFLSIFGAFNVLELPIDCVGKISYRTKLLGYTLIPSLLFGLLQLVAQMPAYARQRGVIQEVAFIGVFLLYPVKSWSHHPWTHHPWAHPHRAHPPWTYHLCPLLGLAPALTRHSLLPLAGHVVHHLLGALVRALRRRLALPPRGDVHRLLHRRPRLHHALRLRPHTADPTRCAPRPLTTHLSCPCAYSSPAMSVCFIVVPQLAVAGVPVLYLGVVHYHRLQLDAVGKLERFLADGHGAGAQDAAARPPPPELVAAERKHQRRRADATRRLEQSMGEWAETLREFERPAAASAWTDDAAYLAAKRAVQRRQLERQLSHAKLVSDVLKESPAVGEALRVLDENLGPEAALMARYEDDASGELLLKLGREEAHDKFIEWHPVLGLELDKTKEAPTINRVWPAHFLPAALSEGEDERGFRNYLAKRLEGLRTRGVDVANDAAHVARWIATLTSSQSRRRLFLRHRRKLALLMLLWMPVRVLLWPITGPIRFVRQLRRRGNPGSSKSAKLVSNTAAELSHLLSKPGRLLIRPGPRWGPTAEDAATSGAAEAAASDAAPYIHLWDALPMWQKRQWVRASEREMPHIGDTLLAVEGVRVEAGVYDPETQTYDHTSTYRKLQLAGSGRQKSAPRTLSVAGGLSVVRDADAAAWRAAAEDVVRQWVVHASGIEPPVNYLDPLATWLSAVAVGAESRPALSVAKLEEALHEYEVASGLNDMTNEAHSAARGGQISMAQRHCCEAARRRARRKVELYVHQLPSTKREEFCATLGLELPLADEVTLWLAREGEGGVSTTRVLKLHKGLRGIVDAATAVELGRFARSVARTLDWLTCGLTGRLGFQLWVLQKTLVGLLQAAVTAGVTFFTAQATPAASDVLAGDGEEEHEHVLPIINPRVPGYIRSLTDAYRIDYAAWEAVECIRKALLCGLFIFFGSGHAAQHFVGILTCVGFVMIYYNVAPYDVAENNTLQQQCQLTIFLALLAALLIKIDDQSQAEEEAAAGAWMLDVGASNVTEAQLTPKDVVGWVLIAVISFNIGLALLFSKLETMGVREVLRPGEELSTTRLLMRNVLRLLCWSPRSSRPQPSRPKGGAYHKLKAAKASATSATARLQHLDRALAPVSRHLPQLGGAAPRAKSAPGSRPPRGRDAVSHGSAASGDASHVQLAVPAQMVGAQLTDEQRVIRNAIRLGASPPCGNLHWEYLSRRASFRPAVALEPQQAVLVEQAPIPDKLAVQAAPIPHASTTGAKTRTSCDSGSSPKAPRASIMRASMRPQMNRTDSKDELMEQISFEKGQPGREIRRPGREIRRLDPALLPRPSPEVLRLHSCNIGGDEAGARESRNSIVPPLPTLSGADAAIALTSGRGSLARTSGRARLALSSRRQMDSSREARALKLSMMRARREGGESSIEGDAPAALSVRVPPLGAKDAASPAAEDDLAPKSLAPTVEPPPSARRQIGGAPTPAAAAPQLVSSEDIEA